MEVVGSMTARKIESGRGGVAQDSFRRFITFEAAKEGGVLSCLLIGTPPVIQRKKRGRKE